MNSKKLKITSPILTLMSNRNSVAFASQRVLGWASTNTSSPLYGQDTVQVFRDIINKIEKKPIHKPECEDSNANCRPTATAQDVSTLCKKKGSPRALAKPQQILVNMETWSEYPSATTFLAVAECLSELQNGNASCVVTDNFTTDSAEKAAPSGAIWVGALRTVEV